MMKKNKIGVICTHAILGKVKVESIYITRVPGGRPIRSISVEMVNPIKDPFGVPYERTWNVKPEELTEDGTL